MKIFSSLWNTWKKLAHKIGVFQSRLILTLFYFFILSPFGIIFSVFKDELRIKNKPKSTWLNKSKQSQTIEDLRQQA